MANVFSMRVSLLQNTTTGTFDYVPIFCMSESRIRRATGGAPCPHRVCRLFMYLKYLVLSIEERRCWCGQATGRWNLSRGERQKEARKR